MWTLAKTNQHRLSSHQASNVTTLRTILNRQWLRSIALMLVALSLPLSAHADGPRDPTVSDYKGDYFALVAGYTFVDSTAFTTGNGFPTSGMYGWKLDRLGKRFSAEVNFTGSILETKGNGTDFYQQMLVVDLVYNLRDGRGKWWTPFVLGGIGGNRLDIGSLATHRLYGFTADVGTGIVSEPLWRRNGVMLRLEARYVFDGIDHGHNEPRVQLGFEVPLGRVERVVEYLPAKEVPQQVYEVREKETIREVVRPWIDSDGDGVDDEHDLCPNTPHGLRVDSHGCVIADQTISLEGVTFETNSSRLTANAKTILDGVSAAFIKQRGLRVEIAGHTDIVGSAAANLKLSQERAESVRSYLIGQGAAENQLIAKGYGKSQLLVSPEVTNTDRERNRRVELRVLTVAPTTKE